MNWTHKSGVKATWITAPSSVTVTQVTAAGSFAVGDLIQVVVSVGTTKGAQSISSITDNLGNTYTSPTGFNTTYNAGGGGGSSSAILAVYYAVNVLAGTPSVTVTFAQVTDWGAALCIDGYTGAIGSTDVVATVATGAYNVAPASNTTPATTNGNELAIAVYADQGGGAANGSPGGGWLVGIQVSATHQNNVVALYQDSGVIGSTLSAGNPLISATVPAQSWAYVCGVLKLSPVAVTDTVTMADAASIAQTASTTPNIADVVTMTDNASITTVTPAGSPSNFGVTVAPSWATWKPPSGRYTFYLADLATNVILDALPLEQVTFTRLLNRAGTFSAKLPLADRSKVPDPVNAMRITTPETTCLYIDKGGQLVFSGSILTRSYDLPTDTLTIQGQDFWYWLGRNNIETNLSYNEDMIQIARDLLAYAQMLPQGNIGLVPDTTVTSGNVIVRNYLGANSSGAGSVPVTGKMIEELAALNPGFEFRARTVWQGGAPARQLQLAYPHFGISSAATQLVWGYPAGAITAMTWPEDGTQTARRVIGLGTQQANGTRPVAYSSQPIAYPRTTEVVTFSVDGSTDIQPLVDAEQALRANPVTIPSVTVYGPQEPSFGSYWEGDHARYRVRANTSGRFWAGMDQVWRIIGLEVTINPDGTETVQHDLAPAAF